MHTHTCTQAHTHFLNPLGCTRMHTRMHTRTHTHHLSSEAFLNPLGHTRARTHTRMHAHTHTSSLLGSLPESLRCSALCSYGTLWILPEDPGHPRKSRTPSKEQRTLHLEHQKGINSSKTGLEDRNARITAFDLSKEKAKYS